MKNYNFCTDYERITNNLVAAGVKYFEDNPSLSSMVLGLSGGVDSAVTATIARRVADITGVRLYGYALPCMTNSHEETSRGISAGKHLCDESLTVNLDAALLGLLSGLDIGLYTKLQGQQELRLDEKIRLGNIKARIRMIHLYNVARRSNGLVLSTDNLTELLLGFWTLHGDVGDFGVIQNLWKTEVFGLAEYLGGDAAEAAQAKPTDGLGISDSDLDQLLPGWEGTYRDGYRAVDEILLDRMLYNANPHHTLIFDDGHPVVQRYNNTHFKRETPVNVARAVALG